MAPHPDPTYAEPLYVHIDFGRESLENQIVSAIGTSIGGIADAIKKFEGAVHESRTKGQLKDVPDLVWYILFQQFEKSCELARKACDAWHDMLENCGKPATLRAIATAWENLGALLADKSAVMNANTFKVDDHWQGDAADKYKARFPRQEKALNDTNNVYCTGMAAALNKNASAVEDMLTTWHNVALDFGGAMAALIASTVAPPAIVAFVVAAAKMCKDIYNGTQKFGRQCSDVQHDLAKLARRRDIFSNGGWPSMVDGIPGKDFHEPGIAAQPAPAN